MTKRFSTPDISDKYPDSLAINIQFRSFGKKEYFCGQVKTAQCPEDNSKVKEISVSYTHLTLPTSYPV